MFRRSFNSRKISRTCRPVGFCLLILDNNWTTQGRVYIHFMYKYIRCMYIYEKVCSSCNKGLVIVVSQTTFNKLQFVQAIDSGSTSKTQGVLQDYHLVRFSSVLKWIAELVCVTWYTAGVIQILSNHSSIIYTVSIVFFFKRKALYF